MAKKPRGDEQEQQQPVAVETPAEGFPVSTDDASEAGPAEADAVSSDDPPAEDAGPVAAADPAPEVNPFDVKREFRQHAVTGEVVAVELVGGQLQGARLCSKPEEQTAGALPVMALEDRESDVAKWYRKNAMDFRPWEPPQPPKMLMDRLRSLYEQAVEARAAYDKAKNAAKFAKDRVEEVDTAIFHALRRMHDVPDSQVELPLEPPALEPPAPEPTLPLTPAEESLAQALDEVNEEHDIHSGDERPLEEGDVIDAEVADDTEDRDERLAAADEE